MDEKENNVEPIKNRRVLSTLFNIFIVFLSIVALAVAGVLIYQKRYLTPFWVNGQSMYPTLNKYALNERRVLCGETGEDTGIYDCDYGVSDNHERALKNLKRFDIVICFYSEDDTTQKIKRVVGLPGETIKFGHGEDNGSLYLKQGEEYTLIPQPIEQKYIVAGTDYPYGDITLGNDEYYVLGDNRAHSSDSRPHRYIKYSWLVGKVVCVCAHCDIIEKEDGTNEPTNIDHFIPRFL